MTGPPGPSSGPYGGGPPPSNQPQMMGQPNSMGPTSGPAGMPPTSFGQYSQPNQGQSQNFGSPPTSAYNGPPTSAYNGPPTSGFGMPPTNTSNMSGPPTSGFGAPQTSHYAGPPTSGFGGPPTTNFGAPSGNMGQGQQMPGMAPTGNFMGGSMPGQGGFPPQQRMPGPGPNAMQQPQAKKLDPDSMPSPVSIIVD